ncbi:MAG TPA: YhdP family protein [Steroidobacteraceae bacterium]|jgi:uncharacterized protein (TIGR02099 family)|nr:YhdP family protein [Steroidobacteraceae bacterium]
MVLRRIGKLLLFAMAGLAILIGSLLLAVKLALDSVPAYQAQIKEWLHRRTGYHIVFSGVSPALRWYGPELTLSGLELRSRDDRRVLARATGGRIGVDIWQLLQNGKLFALRVELDSPDFVIDRLGPSRFTLASEIVLGGEAPTVSALTLNDLPAGALVIHGGSVSLLHWNPQLPRLDLRQVDLELTRVYGLGAARLSARLPPVLGGRLSFTGTVQGPGQMSALRWDAVVNADGVSFPGWRLLLPEYLERLDAGTGAFQAAVHGQGASLARVDLDFGAHGVVTRLADGANSRMDEVSAAMSLTHAGDRWTVLGRRVRVQREGRRDPNSEFDVSWRDNEAGMLDLEAEANYLRAEALLPLVGLMPQKDVRDRLRELSPTGEWMDMHLVLKRQSFAAPWRFDAHARFRDVGFAPVGTAPGLRGLSGTLAGNESAGHVILDTRTAVFNWPSQLPQPLGVPLLNASIYWRRNPEELLVASSDLALRTRDATLHGKVAWHQPSDGSSAVLTMADTVDDGNAGDAHLYFPHALLPPGTLQWLNRAFITGHVSHGDLIFDGPVGRFPFREGGGLFLIRFGVDHMTLDYGEGWPRIENLAAQAEFRNQGLDVKVTSAEVSGLKVDSAQARFVDFRNGELEVHAAGHGDASAAVRYLAATPLDAVAEHAFSSVEAQGPLKADVDLFFPFRQFDQRRSVVHVELGGASLKRTGSSLAATELTGVADIDGAQVIHADLRGRVLGGPMQVTARPPHSRQSTRTHLDIRGSVTGEALHAALALPANIAIGGQTEYRAVLRIAPEPARDRSLSVSSTLQGLDLKLPAPLTKAPEALMPTSVAIQWPASGGEELRLTLGSVLRGAMMLDSGSTGPKLVRAAITFGEGEPVFSDAQAVNIGGTIGELDLAGWLELWGAPTGSAAVGRGSPALAAYCRAAKFEVGKIDFLGSSFSQVAVSVSQDDGAWSIRTSGPSIEGSISLPSPRDPSAPWNLEFQRLEVSDSSGNSSGKAEPAAVDSGGAAPVAPADQKVDPRSIPPIVFHAAAFSWADRQFGDVRATLVKLDDGVRLKQLTAANPDWNAHVSGEWRGADAGSSRIQGTISSTDVGNTLKQLGFAQVIQAKTGRVEFDLTWAGAPSGDILSMAQGRVQVVLDKGQIVGLKPGAGRVLGLASVAELPRRLALDFSDLTDKGFAFDTARGDFELRDGSAHTDDVLVKGPAAEIGLIGRVGLKNRDYDQTAVVTGNVGSTLPLAAFAAGPVVGGAVLLFTQVFKQPLKGLVRGYYRITGSWDNPTVERIKSTGAPAEAAKEAVKDAARDAAKEAPEEMQKQ